MQEPIAPGRWHDFSSRSRSPNATRSKHTLVTTESLNERLLLRNTEIKLNNWHGALCPNRSERFNNGIGADWTILWISLVLERILVQQWIVPHDHQVIWTIITNDKRQLLEDFRWYPKRFWRSRKQFQTFSLKKAGSNISHLSLQRQESFCLTSERFTGSSIQIINILL